MFHKFQLYQIHSATPQSTVKYSNNQSQLGNSMCQTWNISSSLPKLQPFLDGQTNFLCFRILNQMSIKSSHPIRISIWSSIRNWFSKHLANVYFNHYPSWILTTIKHTNRNGNNKSTTIILIIKQQKTPTNKMTTEWWGHKNDAKTMYLLQLTNNHSVNIWPCVIKWLHFFGA